MKRILALILTLIMVATCFTACGKDVKDQTDWEYIKAKGELVVGITYFAPMNYEDENGELTGFETEFAKAVAEERGVKVKFQEIDGNWNGMTITPERQETMEITIPYMQNKQVVVVKAD